MTKKAYTFAVEYVDFEFCWHNGLQLTVFEVDEKKALIKIRRIMYKTHRFVLKNATLLEVK